MQRLIRHAFLALGLAGATLSTPAAADVDFTGKRIELIVAAGAGGSADVLGRFIARNLEQHLPGKPTILVRNITGGGVIVGGNYFQANAKPDGMMLFLATGSSILTPFFGDGNSQVEFDNKTWKQFLAGPSGYVMTGSKVGGITNLQDLKAAIDEQSLIVHGTSSTAGIALLYALAMETTGANYKPIFNVTGADSVTGFLRGEFRINGESIPSYIAITEPLVEQGDVFPLFTVGQVAADGTITRDPALPDVPSFPEAYEIMFGTPPSGPTYDAWLGMMMAMVPNARGVALHGDTPPEILEAYGNAAKQAFTTPEVLEMVRDEMGPYEILTGDEANARLSAALDVLTPELRDYIRNLLMTKFQVKI